MLLCQNFEYKWFNKCKDRVNGICNLLKIFAFLDYYISKWLGIASGSSEKGDVQEFVDNAARLLNAWNLGQKALKARKYTLCPKYALQYLRYDGKCHET